MQMRNVLTYLVLVLAGLFFPAPFYWLVVCALSSQDQIFSIPPRLLPIPPMLTNLRDVFSRTMLLRAFINSTVIALCHVSLALVLCSLAGYAFAKFRDAPGNRWIFAFVL